MQGISIVKAFANEWYEIARYDGKIKEVVKLAIKGKYRGTASLSYFVFWSNRSRSLVWCSIEYQWENECGAINFICTLFYFCRTSLEE
jgi:hypothetical protein